jgi:hypothetical protein
VTVRADGEDLKANRPDPASQTGEVNPQCTGWGRGVPPSTSAEILVIDEVAELLDERAGQAVFDRRKGCPSVSEPDATRPVKHRNAAVPDPPAERCDACLDVSIVRGQADPVLKRIGDDGRVGIRVDEQ